MISFGPPENAPHHSFPRSDALRVLVDAVLGEGDRSLNDPLGHEQAFTMIRLALSVEEQDKGTEAIKSWKFPPSHYSVPLFPLFCFGAWRGLILQSLCDRS